VCDDLNLCHNALFPPFRCRSSVAVLPFPLAVAVSVHRCRCVGYVYMLGSSASMIGWPTTERNNGKIELDPTSTEERLRQLLPFTAVPERNFFSRYFYRTTEFYNGRTAKRQRKNGNGMVEIGQR